MKKWAEIKARKMSPERIARVHREAQEELRELTLRQLREEAEEAGKTQVEVADLAEITQSALSRIERREDNPIEALRRYVEALGGELEVVAVIGNKRVKSLGVQRLAESVLNLDEGPCWHHRATALPMLPRHMDQAEPIQ